VLPQTTTLPRPSCIPIYSIPVAATALANSLTGDREPTASWGWSIKNNVRDGHLVGRGTLTWDAASLSRNNICCLAVRHACMCHAPRNQRREPPKVAQCRARGKACRLLEPPMSDQAEYSIVGSSVGFTCANGIPKKPCASWECHKFRRVRARFEQ
jgi:hypothetical protein